jgi:plastocyanin
LNRIAHSTERQEEAMSVVEKPEQHRIEDRLEALEREERDLERRTDGYQWNHVIALIASGVSLLLALVAIVIAVNADNKTPAASTSAGMAGGMASAMSSAGSGGAAAASTAAPAKTIVLAMKPDAKVGSDGGKHDALLPSADLTVKAGQTVRLTISNYDDMPHSFTSPGLAKGATVPAGLQQMQGTPQDVKVMPMPGMGVSRDIPGAVKGRPSTVTITFTAPSKAGTYIWYCRLPCDAWAMAHDGDMRVHVTVTSA